VSAAPDGFARVATLAEVPVGTMLGVATPGGTRVCLVNDRGAVRAVEDECPHQGFQLSAGELSPDGTIECVWHGARFDCRTGAVLRGPAEEALVRYQVRVDGGDVYVGGRVS
jgi:3-phenylpropionate/trans-cinnamate dioxygenase ferredoxin subunit